MEFAFVDSTANNGMHAFSCSVLMRWVRRRRVAKRVLAKYGNVTLFVYIFLCCSIRAVYCGVWRCDR